MKVPKSVRLYRNAWSRHAEIAGVVMHNRPDRNYGDLVDLFLD